MTHLNINLLFTIKIIIHKCYYCYNTNNIKTAINGVGTTFVNVCLCSIHKYIYL